MASVSTSCLNDSYVDFADAEKSLNVANETEIASRNSLQWIQKEQIVHQAQQAYYAREPGHDSTSTFSLTCKKTRQPVLYPVKKVFLQQDGKVFAITKATESGDIAENTRRTCSFQVPAKEFGRIYFTCVNKPLKLSRPNGVAFNLQNPNASVPNMHMKRVTHWSAQPHRASCIPKEPFVDQCRTVSTLPSHNSKETSVPPHAFRTLAKVEQSTTGYTQSYAKISHGSTSPVSDRKTYSGVPLTPLLSLSGQAPSSSQFCNIKVNQIAPPVRNIQSSYPLAIIPPAESCTKQENEIDYSLLDEFFIRNQ